MSEKTQQLKTQQVEDRQKSYNPRKGQPCPYRPTTCQEEYGCTDCDYWREHVHGEINVED